MIEDRKMATLRVVDYAPTPGGRFAADGPYSGEWFREEVLRNALENAQKRRDRLEVFLDDAAGYGSSFLEEAFGGLVRKGYFSHQDLDRILTVTAQSDLYRYYADLARKYIRKAQPERMPA